MLTGSAYAYDGDSIFFEHKAEVRLAGIDAPERDQACLGRDAKFWPCGIASRDALRQMIGNREVRCAITGKDKYRRLLGTCYADGVELNRAMVKQGQATAYRHFSMVYVKEEEEARAQARGIWADKQFTEPYLCRHPQPGHVCYEYDFATQTAKAAEAPLVAKRH